MSPALHARAPGKLFLLGEYAVLDGAPAIVAGVDRYVSVRVAPCRAPRVRISAPGHADAVEFPLGAPPPAEPGLRFALIAFAHAIAARPRAAAHGMELSIASQLDGDAGATLGLGSSAAVTVATVAAIFALADGAPRAAAQASRFRDAVFATAWRAHSAAQGGVGSGADVAASAHGGIVRVQPRGRLLPPQVRALPRPLDAILLAAWTGAAAATVELAKRYIALPHDERRAAFQRASRASVDWLARALRCGTLPSDALEAGGTALAQLAAATGLPLLTPRLRELVAIARAHGAAAKPSGAGGGDCGIALTASHCAARRIRAAWRAAGLLPLDLDLSPHGVTVDAA